MNRKNATTEKKLTTDMVAKMNFREFAETVAHELRNDVGAAAEQNSEANPRTKVRSRDINSGHWVLKPRQKRRHIRFSTVLYTDKACLYESEDISDSTTFFSLPLNKRKQLYRAYM